MNRHQRAGKAGDQQVVQNLGAELVALAAGADDGHRPRLEETRELAAYSCVLLGDGHILPGGQECMILAAVQNRGFARLARDFMRGKTRNGG